MNTSLVQLIQVQFKQFFREPAIIFWAIVFPILMAWVLGIAFTEKREVKKTVYVIPGHTRLFDSDTTETLVGEETGNPVKIKFVLSTKDQATKAIQKGEIALFMEYAEDSILYHFDPHNADAQLTHLMLEREFIKKSLGGSVSNLKAFSSSVSPLTTKGTRYIDFLIPGLIALGILNSCLWGIGWNLIETRMKKLLRRMVATPMKKPTFLFSLIATRIVLSAVESIILFAFAFFFFKTTIAGSIPALIIVYLAGIFAFSGIAILTASRTDNSQVGNGLINAITLPMMILSGIFFSYQNFPDWAIPVIKAFPLTLLADSLRAIFIEGSGMVEIVKPTLILLVTGLVTFITGLKLFKWY